MSSSEIPDDMRRSERNPLWAVHSVMLMFFPVQFLGFVYGIMLHQWREGALVAVECSNEVERRNRREPVAIGDARSDEVDQAREVE